MASILYNYRHLKRNRVVALAMFIVVVLMYYFLRGGNLFGPSRIDQTEYNTGALLETIATGCEGHFTGYGHEFVWLQYARLDKVKRTFSIPCKDTIPTFTFLFGKEGTPLQGWLDNMTPDPQTGLIPGDGNLVSSVTVAVMRIEAHNLYHTICEWYNVFLLSKLLNFDARKVDILFMDDRPVGHMDETWDALFGKVVRYSDVETNAVFKDLIWNMIGYESPMNFHMLHKLPYVNEFHNFFISTFGVEKTKALDCSKLSVTIIWRRDYMSHPERKELFGGQIHRKFQNENEILHGVKTIFAEHNIREVVLESMGMKEQVELFTNTDVLIGMHGAGMAHVMFLPQHAVVLEFFPKYWGFLKHFKAAARWRNLKYFGWQNSDQNNEFPGFHTRIPQDIVRSHLKLIKAHLCP